MRIFTRNQFLYENCIWCNSFALLYIRISSKFNVASKTVEIKRVRENTNSALYERKFNSLDLSAVNTIMDAVSMIIKITFGKLIAFTCNLMRIVIVAVGVRSLREGNVFTHVCLSSQGVSNVTTTHVTTIGEEQVT